MSGNSGFSQLERLNSNETKNCTKVGLDRDQWLGFVSHDVHGQLQNGR
jgi:hypothetical protein